MHSPSLLLRARVVVPVSRPPLADGAVLVAGGRILEVGPFAELRARHPVATLHELGDAILLPGLINAHCHLDYTHMAGGIPPQRTFPDWIKAILAHKAAWSYTDFAQSWLAGAAMLLRNGVTTVLDIEAVPELLGEVWPATPLRVISAIEMTGIRSGKPPAELIAEATRAFPATGDATKTPALSPHAPYSTRPELFPLAAAAARERGWLWTTHIAESHEEFALIASQSGPLHDWLQTQRDLSGLRAESPVKFLDRLGVLSPQLLAVHANCLIKGDAERLAASGTSVVHCPLSHDYFRHPAFPFAELSAAGVNVCLGTDSLASVRGTKRDEIELCLFREMRQFARVFADTSPAEILRMVTVNAARALGRSGELGELAPGALADLIVIPCPASLCEHDSLSIDMQILKHSGPVIATMIGGKWRQGMPATNQDQTGDTHPASKPEAQASTSCSAQSRIR